MDAQQLGRDLADIACALCPIVLVLSAVAAIWWAIARSRRQKAQWEQRPQNEPPYPRVSDE